MREFWKRRLTDATCATVSDGKKELLYVCHLCVWYSHIHRWWAAPADKDQAMMNPFGAPLASHDSWQRMPRHSTDQWSDWSRRGTHRWLREMVVFPGEGAVESFIECLAVLFVSFDCGQDHLRFRRDLERRKRKRDGEIRQQTNGLLIRQCVCMQD